MKALCVFIASFLAVAYSVTTTGKVCTETSQCQPGECCQIMSEYMIVSKRDLVDNTLIPSTTKTGTCEPYTLEGDSCGHFDKLNGFCSCEPGTYCKTSEVPVTDMPRLFRRKMAAPRPGYQWVSKCTKN